MSLVQKAKVPQVKSVVKPTLKPTLKAVPKPTLKTTIKPELKPTLKTTIKPELKQELKTEVKTSPQKPVKSAGPIRATKTGGLAKSSKSNKTSSSKVVVKDTERRSNQPVLATFAYSPNGALTIPVVTTPIGRLVDEANQYIVTVGGTTVFDSADTETYPNSLFDLPCSSQAIVINASSTGASYLMQGETLSVSIAAGASTSFTIGSSGNTLTLSGNVPWALPSKILCGKCYLAIAIYTPDKEWVFAYPLGIPGVRVNTTYSTTQCDATEITDFLPSPYDVPSDPDASIPDVCVKTILTTCEDLTNLESWAVGALGATLNENTPAHWASPAELYTYTDSFLESNPWINHGQGQSSCVCENDISAIQSILNVPILSFDAPATNPPSAPSQIGNWSLQYKDCTFTTEYKCEEVAAPTCDLPNGESIVYYVRSYVVARTWWAWTYVASNPSTPGSGFKCDKKFLATQTYTIHVFATAGLITDPTCHPTEYEQTYVQNDAVCDDCVMDCIPCVEWTRGVICTHDPTKWLIDTLTILSLPQDAARVTKNANLSFYDEFGCPHVLYFNFSGYQFNINTNAYDFTIVGGSLNIDNDITGISVFSNSMSFKLVVPTHPLLQQQTTYLANNWTFTITCPGSSATTLTVGSIAVPVFTGTARLAKPTVESKVHRKLKK